MEAGMGRRRRGGAGGSVLIIVLWIAFGLVSIALYFGHSMVLAYRAADQYQAGVEADLAMEGAARYVGYILTNAATIGQMPETNAYLSAGVPIGNSTFWLIGRGDPDARQTAPTYGLIDEGSKLNINTASVAMLEGLPRMTAELAAAIVDWRDADETVTTGGAESETYQRRDPPYYCKNAPFETMEELRLVAGTDLTILYGEDANLNGILDTNENDGAISPPDDNRDGKLDPGILEYVTVFSRFPGANNSFSTNMMVNVNSASEAVLACIPGIGTTNAAQVAAYRRSKTTDQLSDISWLAQVLDQASMRQATNYLTTKTYQFSADIVVVGHDGKGYRRSLFVFDTSEGEPKIIYRRDRGRLGWALGSESRINPTQGKIIR
jgi:DNA uptake protein ComE-like DNA-binding protein